MSDDPERVAPTEEAHRSAIHRVGRWPGWIWSVPIAALAIVAWLGFRALTSGGPSVTVVFTSAGGIDPGNTRVQYQGMQVGQVASVHLEKDLRHVDVMLNLDPEMSGHLGRGTLFWLQGESPSLGNLASLKSVIAGPSIGMWPAPGSAHSRYQGLQQRPEVLPGEVGTLYVLTASSLGNLGKGSAVFYRGHAAGEVKSTMVDPDGHGFRAHVFVDSPYDAFVHADTRFWNAGAARLSTGAGGPQLRLQSLPALLHGAVAFETPPEGGAGRHAKAGTVFPLYDGKDAAQYAPDRDAVAYRVTFRQPDDALPQGAAVTLGGKRVGSVGDTALDYDPSSGDLLLRATLWLEPSRIHLQGATWHDRRAQMDAMLDHLIGEGLRAGLARAPPLVGASEVQLAFSASPGQVALLSGGTPGIPTSGGGGGIGGVLTAAHQVMAKIETVPIDQIAREIHEATQRLATLAQSPALTDSLQHLRYATADLQDVTRDARRDLPQTLASVRRAAQSAQATIADARRLLSQQGTSSPDATGLPQALYELSRAARALRELADYLDRHPEALIEGRR